MAIILTLAFIIINFVQILILKKVSANITSYIPSLKKMYYIPEILLGLDFLLFVVTMLFLTDAYNGYNDNTSPIVLLCMAICIVLLIISYLANFEFAKFISAQISKVKDDEDEIREKIILDYRKRNKNNKNNHVR